MNPIGGIDIAAIEAAMKQSSLDHLKGYNQTNYPTVIQPKNTEYIPKYSAKGYHILREPAWNKGTSFTPEDRINKNLTGLIPHVLETENTMYPSNAND
ncbi:hypothetical protein OCU04_009944 [Sclerotinia nivalis]|uniref:Uncharacterized protein n=1 Tax=Sclerotinia nivalis TaxID=352851 RepID=A0A9X0ADQ4_9HELO|nr:hypothetical protein OCU04_009944 [Sclerotinia nivalis]